MKQKIKKIIKGNTFFYALLSPISKTIWKIKNRNQIFYENLFSNIIEGNLLITLNNIPGKFEMDARSHILKKILLSKHYEPEIVDLILSKTNPLKDAINIGANIGLYTNLLANNINNKCKVLAVEPTPNAYKYLKANTIRNNNDSKVILYNGIAADKPGNYKINIVPGNEEYSSMGKMVHSNIINKGHISIDVPGDTIDNLVKEHNITPGIIIIDVEGAEYHVLTGAIETLKKYNPIIITELDDNLLSNQNSNSLQVIKFLNDINYKIIDTNNNTPTFPFMGNIIAEFKN